MALGEESDNATQMEYIPFLTCCVVFVDLPFDMPDCGWSIFPFPYIARCFRESSSWHARLRLIPLLHRHSGSDCKGAVLVAYLVPIMHRARSEMF